MSESVFKTFKVEDKIEELKALLGEKGISIFKDKRVVIAVPVYDESMRNIELFDNELYITQKNDLEQFRHLFMQKTKVGMTNIIYQHYCVPTARSIGFDYLILLHEFTQSEEDNLIKELQTNNSRDFKVYKLY